MKFFFCTAQSLAKPFLVFLFVALSAHLFAQQASLSVQGVLTKADGTAVEDDVYTLTFRLWNHPDATGGTNKKHEETINNVETVGGVYTVIMGINGTPLSAGFDEVYYLGVSMNTSNVELLPRPRLTHAPYALGIRGQNNVFPSTGAVIADELNVAGSVNATVYKAEGGVPTANIATNGYSFGTGGDSDGGLFSVGDNNVGLYANAIKALEATSAGVSIPGSLNTGTLTSNDHTINGNSQVNGWQVVTGDERVEGNQVCNNKFLTRSTGDGGGYTFTYDGGYDTGMFGLLDGEFDLRSNGGSRLLFGSNGINYQTATVFTNGIAISDNGQPWNNSNLKVYGLKEGPSGGKNVQWDPGTGSIYWDNSSRKSKRDIKKFDEDFSRILLTEAKIYRRHGSPDSYWEIGYIAEEIDSLGLTHLATRGLDGQVDGLDYDRIGLYSIELLKIQHADIETLKAEIAALKAANKGLQVENSALSAENNKFQQQQEVFNAQLEVLSKRMNLLENTRMANTRK
ncbi:MAG: hypothetical protein IT270_10745 [Saprospiraceae bacterium]|nr:hypothetical protein [Saprospiraceae bacterium]